MWIDQKFCRFQSIGPEIILLKSVDFGHPVRSTPYKNLPYGVRCSMCDVDGSMCDVDFAVNQLIISKGHCDYIENYLSPF